MGDKEGFKMHRRNRLMHAYKHLVKITHSTLQLYIIKQPVTTEEGIKHSLLTMAAKSTI